jgi:predicted nucleotide-binding protein
MASKRPPAPVRPVHSIPEKRYDIKMIERRIAELEAFDLNTVTSRFNDPKVGALQSAIQGTLAQVFGIGSDDYSRYSRAVGLDHGPVTMVMDGWRDDAREVSEARQYLSEGRTASIELLRQAIRQLEEEIEREEALSGEAGAPVLTASVVRAQSRHVFIVHGRDGEMREAVARFLTEVGFQPIILHEQPNGGKTVIEKFEANSEPAGFAVVLLSGDDEGRLKGANDLASRARQNVILELGYFVGKLGRSRVCTLKRGHLEEPSDIVGVVFESYDDAGAWKQIIARELQAAGYEVDWNKVMRR